MPKATAARAHPWPARGAACATDGKRPRLLLFIGMHACKARRHNPGAGLLHADSCDNAACGLARTAPGTAAISVHAALRRAARGGSLPVQRRARAAFRPGAACSGHALSAAPRRRGGLSDGQEALDRQVALAGVVVEAQHRGAGRQLGQLLRDRRQRGARRRCPPACLLRAAQRRAISRAASASTWITPSSRSVSQVLRDEAGADALDRVRRRAAPPRDHRRGRRLDREHLQLAATSSSAPARSR